jgi:hypothetical protein
MRPVTDTAVPAQAPPQQDRPAERTVGSRRLVLGCLALVSVVTATIHFAVAGEHFKEYWVFGAFMLGSAWLQLLWSGLAVLPAGPVLRQPLVLVYGLVLNAGIVVVYVLTRTVGDMVGPDPRDVEPVGFGDGLCTALEAVVAVACLVLLLRSRERQVAWQRVPWALGTVGALSAVLLSVALLDGGSEMVMSMTDDASTSTVADGMAPMSATPGGLSLPTASPAGNITMPDPNMQMEPGMRMAGPMCSTVPTSAQQAAAVGLVNSSWAGSSKYQSLSAAKAAGYRAITPTGLPVVHYLNPRYYRTTIRGGPVIDPTQPQSLVYANTPKGSVLVAAMFIMTPFTSTAPPQPGGCLTQWHVHLNLCLGRGGVVALTNPGCPAGSFNVVTPPMLHVWFVPIPGGPTAVDASDSQVVQAAEHVTTTGNPVA